MPGHYRGTSSWLQDFSRYFRSRGATALASPRPPLRMTALAATRCSVANATAGCRRADTVFANNANTPCPVERRRGRQTASALYWLTTTRPMGKAVEPALQPSVSTGCRVAFPPVFARRDNGFGYG